MFLWCSYFKFLNNETIFIRKMLKRNDTLYLLSLFCRLPPEAVGISELEVKSFIK